MGCVYYFTGTNIIGIYYWKTSSRIGTLMAPGPSDSYKDWENIIKLKHAPLSDKNQFRGSLILPKPFLPSSIGKVSIIALGAKHVKPPREHKGKCIVFKSVVTKHKFKIKSLTTCKVAH